MSPDDLAALQEERRVLAVAARKLNCSMDEVPERIDRLKDELISIQRHRLEGFERWKAWLEEREEAARPEK